jgi:hypothetical protein
MSSSSARIRLHSQRLTSALCNGYITASEVEKLGTLFIPDVPAIWQMSNFKRFLEFVIPLLPIEWNGPYTYSGFKKVLYLIQDSIAAYVDYYATQHP